jgi:hypothetical protein
VNSPVPSKHGSRLPSGFTTIRDALTFLVGIIIIGYEVFVSTEVEIGVLAVGLTMTGLPVVFGADERRKGGPPE